MTPMPFLPSDDPAAGTERPADPESLRAHSARSKLTIHLSEWLGLAVSLAFAIVGMHIWLDTGSDMGLFVGCFFGLATLGNVSPTWQRYRQPEPPLAATVIGSVPIRPARRKLVLIGAICTLLGAMLCIWALWRLPLAGLLGLPLLVTGAIALIGCFMGWLPVGYLRFDPDGLLVGRSRRVRCIDWDDIADVAATSYAGQAAVVVSVKNPASNSSEYVDPMCQRSRNKQISSDASEMIFPTPLGISAPVLVAAIQHYVNDHGARTSLAKRALDYERA